MNNSQIKQRVIEKSYADAEQRSLSRREFCALLKLTSPENSDEWHLLNDAETLYEMAESLKNKTCRAQRARNKARYRFKKAWAMREQRLKDIKKEV